MYIKVLKVTDQDDGSALVDLEYGQEFVNCVKKLYKRKRCTKKLIQTAITTGLTNYINSKEKKKQ